MSITIENCTCGCEPTLQLKSEFIIFCVECMRLDPEAYIASEMYSAGMDVMEVIEDWNQRYEDQKYKVSWKIYAKDSH